MAHRTAENLLFALAERTNGRRGVAEERIAKEGQINGKKVNDMAASGPTFAWAQL
jgi:hypothetical protein